MSVSSSSRSRTIDRLDFDSNRHHRSSSHDSAIPSERTSLLASDESFFSDVVEGAIDRDRKRMAQTIIRYLSFASAILNCLCAGSMTAFSLFGPYFISHLRYTQYQVNAVSTAAELAIYSLTPLYGWLCDRFSPRPISVVSAVLFGGGYLLAGLTYHAGPVIYSSKSQHDVDTKEVRVQGWPFAVMVISFIGIGAGTACMYLAAVTTCAKNFGRGRHKGVALALPIACFGMSGFWQSQVGSHLFKENDGSLDVFRYFIFLAVTLFAVGLLGGLGLNIVGEDELVEEAVEELERSGLLNGDSSLHDREDTGLTYPRTHSTTNDNGYGTLETHHPAAHTKRRDSHTSDLPTSLKKRLVLRLSLPVFLRDPTMWLLTLGFFLTAGPGDTYINNIGSILLTSYPDASPPSVNQPATHVGIIALSSTVARVMTGFITDLVAPTSTAHSVRESSAKANGRFTISRIWFLLGNTVLFSIGLLLLATPLGMTNANPTFFISSTLIGLGYGAVFSLVPIIISCVWGVEHFGTNWGTVAIVPGVGAALWSWLYARVYQTGVEDEGEGAGLACFGSKCYQGAFLAMAISSWVAIACWGEASRRWRRRNVVV